MMKTSKILLIEDDRKRKEEINEVLKKDVHTFIKIMDLEEDLFESLKFYEPDFIIISQAYNKSFQPTLLSHQLTEKYNIPVIILTESDFKPTLDDVVAGYYYIPYSQPASLIALVELFKLATDNDITYSQLQSDEFLLKWNHLVSTQVSDKNLPVDTFAELLELNPRTLILKISECFGMTTKKLLNHVHLNTAYLLYLGINKGDLEKSGEQTGYTDLRYLRKLMKKAKKHVV